LLAQPLDHPELLQLATTIEVKSGYACQLDAELKQLRVIQRLSEQLPVTLIPTFLGAHEVPPEYRNKRADYVAAHL